MGKLRLCAGLLGPALGHAGQLQEPHAGRLHRRRLPAGGEPAAAGPGPGADLQLRGRLRLGRLPRRRHRMELPGHFFPLLGGVDPASGRGQVLRGGCAPRQRAVLLPREGLRSRGRGSERGRCWRLAAGPPDRQVAQSALPRQRLPGNRGRRPPRAVGVSPRQLRHQRGRRGKAQEGSLRSPLRARRQRGGQRRASTSRWPDRRRARPWRAHGPTARRVRVPDRLWNRLGVRGARQGAGHGRVVRHPGVPVLRRLQGLLSAARGGRGGVGQRRLQPLDQAERREGVRRRDQVSRRAVVAVPAGHGHRPRRWRGAGGLRSGRGTHAGRPSAARRGAAERAVGGEDRTPVGGLRRLAGLLGRPLGHDARAAQPRRRGPRRGRRGPRGLPAGGPGPPAAAGPGAGVHLHPQLAMGPRARGRRGLEQQPRGLPPLGGLEPTGRRGHLLRAGGAQGWGRVRLLPRGGCPAPGREPERGRRGRAAAGSARQPLARGPVPGQRVRRRGRRGPPRAVQLSARHGLDLPRRPCPDPRRRVPGEPLRCRGRRWCAGGGAAAPPRRRGPVHGPPGPRRAPPEPRGPGRAAHRVDRRPRRGRPAGRARLAAVAGVRVAGGLRGQDRTRRPDVCLSLPQVGVSTVSIGALLVRAGLPEQAGEAGFCAVGEAGEAWAPPGERGLV
mmetsp:Transcript_29414/g.78647  ORF Transcript_29414/g.78647 Transcript_29414/m.78647 type:complete len:671 (-) Transcript_29414:226-2238(-)